MAHVKVNRISLAWPTQQAGTQIAKGVPRLPGSGLVAQCSNDAAGSAAYANPASSLDLVSRYGQRIMLPKDTIAIGIAPDSVIHSCDIWLAGRGESPYRWRISPGNPYVGCPDDDFAIITTPNSIPLFITDAFMAFSESVKSFETGGAFVPGWPLRLEIMHGCGVVPMRTHLRAPQYERAVFIDIDTAENIGQRSFFVCVDGRSKIRVSVASGGAGVTLRCFAWDTLPDTDNTDAADEVQLALDDAGAMTLLITTRDTVTFEGAPMTVLEVRVTASADNTDAFINVEAWD